MMAKRPRHDHRLRSNGGLPAAKLLHFIELDGFSEDWKRLGLNDEDLASLQLTIIGEGRHAPLIAGTGGLRKLRFAPPRWNVGRRGATRVCFALFEEYGIVLLVMAYAKNEVDDISDKGKAYFKQLLIDAKAEIVRLKAIHRRKGIG
jgi:hypothetical protein